MFLALLNVLPKGSIHKLGGWTQTSTRVSPLSDMVFEQERRLMRQLCFNCGGNHWSKSCPKTLQGVTYRCDHCKCSILITSRGQSDMGTSAPAPPAPAPPAPAPPAPAAKAAPKRQASAEALAPPAAKRLRVQQKTCMTVQVCGHKYTTLSFAYERQEGG